MEVAEEDRYRDEEAIKAGGHLVNASPFVSPSEEPIGGLNVNEVEGIDGVRKM